MAMKRLGRPPIIPPGGMKIKNVWIALSTESRLRETSFQLGIAQSEIMREGIELALTRYERQSSQSVKKGEGEENAGCQHSLGQ